jgi:hypothetical protein
MKAALRAAFIIFGFYVLSRAYTNSKNGYAIFRIKKPYWGWFLIPRSVTTLLGIGITLL